MASSWSITINQQPDGTVTFTPYVPNAHAGQPLGVGKDDLVTWNNQTNSQVQLQSIQPKGTYLTEPIPAGKVSNPIFQASATIGYSRVRPGLTESTPPDHWIIVIPPPAVA